MQDVKEVATEERRPVHEPAGKHRRWLAIIGTTVLALLVYVGSVAGFAYLRLQGNFDRQDISALLSDDRPDRDGAEVPGPFKPGQPVNLLIIGSDARQGAADIDGAGQAGEVTGMRSDTTMLVHVSADKSRVEIVSIPRDMLIDIPSCRLPTGAQTAPQYEAMFNSAFSLGGQTGDTGSAAACTIRTVEDMTDIYIDGFVVVDFDSFKTFVDALGGVEMCFDEQLTDATTGLDLGPGCEKLIGEQALQFARARKGLTGGSDIGRMDRQQELVKAIVDEAVSKNIMTNLPSLYRFIDAVSQSVVTDSELGDIDTLSSFAYSLRSISSDRIFAITMPWLPAGNRLLPAPLSESVWEALREDRPLDEVITRDGEPVFQDAENEGSEDEADEKWQAPEDSDQ